VADRTVYLRVAGLPAVASNRRGIAVQGRHGTGGREASDCCSRVNADLLPDSAALEPTECGVSPDRTHMPCAVRSVTQRDTTSVSKKPVDVQTDAPMPCQGFCWHFRDSFPGLKGMGARAGCWIADKTGRGRSPGGGQALIRSRPAGQVMAGDGRRIVRRPARSRQPIIGSGRPRSRRVSRRWRAGGGRPRGRRSA
jgi:hypothetical protein